jgi:putative oxidoreductase
MAIDGGLLVLRLATGLVFAAHGAQKTFGVWGGQGLRGWQGTMDRMGYRPTYPFAVLSALAELVGGLLIAVGLLTPLAGLLVVGQSVVIVVGVHWKRGFFNRDNGIEFPLVLGAGFLAILLAGPGAISVDAVIGFLPSDEVRVGLAVLALVGGAGMVALARVMRPAQPTA